MICIASPLSYRRTTGCRYSWTPLTPRTSIEAGSRGRVDTDRPRQIYAARCTVCDGTGEVGYDVTTECEILSRNAEFSGRAE